MFSSRRLIKYLVNTLIAIILLINPVCQLPVYGAEAENTAVQAANTTITVDKTELTSDIAPTNADASQNLTNKEKTVALANTYLNNYLANGKKNGPKWLQSTDIQFSVAENNKPVYSIETLQPFGNVTNNGQLWFWQARDAHSSDTQNTANLGFGWRKLSDDKSSMIGLNTFYDRSFQYNLERIGVGAEYFNKLAEYRTNWYHPVSGEREIDSTNSIFIRAVEGFDAEVGTSFVHMPWVKLFAGGYYWDNKYHDDEKGYKLRSVAQLTSRISLEAGYTHSNFKHEPYGIITYALGSNDTPALLGHTTKSAAKRVDLSDKLLQKVQRQNNITTEYNSKSSSANTYTLTFTQYDLDPSVEYGLYIFDETTSTVLYNVTSTNISNLPSQYNGIISGHTIYVKFTENEGGTDYYDHQTFTNVSSDITFLEVFT